jgi:hypothetical protein
MYKLTDRRLAAARDILDKYAGQLETRRPIESGLLEKELREVWDIGYQEQKNIIIDLLKNDRYRLIDAYYMQHQNAPGPVSEFQPHLAGLYGTRMYDPFDKEGKQKQFWDAAFGANLA